MTPRPAPPSRGALAACIAACVLAGGCLSAARMKADVRSGAVRGAIVEGVPFVRQRRNTCGPAALASVMLHSGAETSEDRISAALGTIEKGGAVTFDLALHPRDEGLIAIQRYEVADEELRAAVRSGVPPVIMLGGLLSIIGRYHYAVITGYDETRRAWLLHYGVKPDVVMGFERLRKLRGHADGWALYVSNPDDRPAGLPPELHLEMGLAAEKLGRPEAARFHYSHATWTPEAPQAMMNMSNVALGGESYARAEEFLRKALDLKPDFPAAKNNLAWALLKQKKALDEAEHLAREAARDEKTRPFALDTLADILEAAGKPEEAARVRGKIEKLKAAPRTGAPASRDERPLEAPAPPR